VNALGRGLEDLWVGQRVDNCQISRLEWVPGSGFRLIELADVSHLESVGTLRGWRTEPQEERTG
jgi:hypothetical protein